MTKHTAGPWRVGDAGCTVFGPPNGQPAPERIASLANRGDKTKANARLIAAAPEMYEALGAIINMNPDNYNDAAAAMQQYAREALAKAEGR